MNYRHSYLVNFQYLGFRLHGWQKQPKLKTVHAFVDKTLKFTCKDTRFKSVGVGRTDAKVSSTDYYFQLFIDAPIQSIDFIREFNLNSPSDIRVMSVEVIQDVNFNIIQHPKQKEYRYYFSFGQKNHPYCAPLLACFLNNLDIDVMKTGARLFQGTHNYKHYCTKPSLETKVVRTIDSCVIHINTDLQASFFPKESYVLVIKGEGFLRNQIRLIMGALVELGKGTCTLKDIQNSLEPDNNLDVLKTIAPASGLHLHKVVFKL